MPSTSTNSNSRILASAVNDSTRTASPEINKGIWIDHDASFRGSSLEKEPGMGCSEPQVLDNALSQSCPGSTNQGLPLTSCGFRGEFLTGAFLFRNSTLAS